MNARVPAMGLLFVLSGIACLPPVQEGETIRVDYPDPFSLAGSGKLEDLRAELHLSDEEGAPAQVRMALKNAEGEMEEVRVQSPIPLPCVDLSCGAVLQISPRP
jgi:hypothetical protein